MYNSDSFGVNKLILVGILSFYRMVYFLYYRNVVTFLVHKCLKIMANEYRNPLLVLIMSIALAVDSVLLSLAIAECSIPRNI